MTDKVQLIKEEIEKRFNISLEQGYTYSAAQLKRIIDFIDSFPEELVSEDLEEEIDRFEDWLNNFNQSDYPTSYTVRDIARHFAKWQKQQTMKNAVEGLICGHDDNTPAWIDLSIKNKPNANVGDKVKIIVIKDEE